MSGTAIGVGITANVVTELLKVLVPSITQNIKSFAWGFKDDLENLEEKFKYIQSVMEDFENIKISNTTEVWLKDLRDIAYDADDVLDDFSYQVMHKETIKGLKNKVRDSFCVSSNNPLYMRFKIAGKIKVINKRLEVILKNKDMFRFPNNSSNTASTSTAPQGQSSADNRETTSFIEGDASNFVGRDMDRSEIVKSLRSSSPQSERLPVVPILGMGGIGKTTLAQFVYKDELVVKCFEIRIWIYVSENFDFNMIAKGIINQLTKNNMKSDTSSSREVLVRELHENLSGKKFLLVLDDLWNEDIDDWEKLKTALSVGADGSKILVTTRNDTVVSTVHGRNYRYHLAHLSEDECWSIIMKKAFAAGGAKETTSMVEIGEQIAKKCGGLPLVARTLGSLMYKKNTIDDWESIKENKVFKMKESESKIIMILKLSYDNLPSRIKRCFSYCCLFPKGFPINRTTLINLWMAEGFLQQSSEGNGKTMECMGNEYFNHLLQNSLIQDDFQLFGETITFKMHDLMHDVARLVLDNYECSVWNTNEPKNDSKVCRVQVALEGNEISAPFWKSLADTKKLRTIIAIQRDFPSGAVLITELFYTSQFYDCQLEMFLANSKLRVLHVMVGSNCEKFLASVSKLRHLRYLRLKGSETKKDLILENRTIAALYHLQTLKLDCHIKKLPEDIGSLINLRHLDLSFNKNLERLPESITNLMSLQTLVLSYCGLKCLPREIGALKHLKCLRLLGNKIQGLPESITGCCYLENLELGYCELISSLPGNIGDLQYLCRLDLSRARILSDLPASICDLLNLTWLGVGDCCLLEKLPASLGALNKLRHLDFSGTKINELPESCDNGLQSLETLIVTEDFVFSKEVKNWISLKHLRTSPYEDIQRTMPVFRARGIRRLTSLQTLKTYFVGKNRGTDDQANGIEELRELNLLEGYLQIRDLQYVRGGIEEARRANLHLKINISNLKLHWCKRVIKVEEEVVNDDAPTDEYIEVQEKVSTHVFSDASKVEVGRNKIALKEEVVSDEDAPIDEFIEVNQEVEEEYELDEEVLEGLQPQINLRELVVENFLGKKLPSWLMSLPYLVEIDFYKCIRCERILGLGLLICLKNLSLWGLEKLEQWVEPSLTGELQETCFYPCLEKLEIRFCQNMAVVPSSSFPSLKYLHVEETNATGLCSLLRNNITSLVKVKVRAIPGLMFLPVEMFQPSLQSLQLTWCLELRGFVSYEEKESVRFSQMTSLRTVVIQYSEKWKPLEDLQCLPNLEELDLRCHIDKVESSSASTSSVVTPPSVEATEEEAEGIQHLMSLRYLYISGWPKTSSLPQQLQYLINLRYIWISKFDGLEALPEWLGNLSSLERLYITECKNLRRLPSKKTIQRLASLKTLYVADCRQLEEGCADKQGEEFQKISRIENMAKERKRHKVTREAHATIGIGRLKGTSMPAICAITGPLWNTRSSCPDSTFLSWKEPCSRRSMTWSAYQVSSVFRIIL